MAKLCVNQALRQYQYSARLALILALLGVLACPVLAQQGARRDEPAAPVAAKAPVLTSPPVLQVAAAPIYPPAAAAANLEAQVKVPIIRIGAQRQWG